VKEEARRLLEKALRAIQNADDMLHRRNDVDFAAARAYYAMFYVAKALLREKHLDSRKHGGIHALFAEHFTKSGLLDAKFHRWLLSAFDRRVQADYLAEVKITREDVELMLDQARELLTAAKALLGVTE
jgi:uncharacterized protein (UPF0332 family)